MIYKNQSIMISKDIEPVSQLLRNLVFPSLKSDKFEILKILLTFRNP